MEDGGAIVGIGGASRFFSPRHYRLMFFRGLFRCAATGWRLITVVSATV
jgi:hypothetical protein